MEKLLAFINGLSRENRAAFFRRADSTEGYLRKAISARDKLRPELCVRIEFAADGAVTRKDLRPDDWISIWPELATVAA